MKKIVGNEKKYVDVMVYSFLNDVENILRAETKLSWKEINAVSGYIGVLFIERMEQVARDYSYDFCKLVVDTSKQGGKNG